MVLFILIGPEDRRHLEAIQSGRAPRLDYRLVAERCQGEIRQCYSSPAALDGPKVLRTFRSMAANIWIAVQVLKSAPAGSVIYSTGETWGLPVAIASTLLGRLCHTHIVYVHRVYSPMWLRLLHHLRSFLHVDGWICITEHQAHLLHQLFGPCGVPVAAVSQGVDTAFFDPVKTNPSHRSSYVLSIGAEMRNYPLLFEAVRDLDVEVIVKASSTWMATARQQVTSVPPNVTLLSKHLSYPELRELYAGASLVVLPLHDTPQAAGITTILEAMAMGKCVVATRSKGLPDALMDGVTGAITEPTSSELSQTIENLLSRPDWTKHLAMNSYQLVRQEASLEAHATGIESFIDQLHCLRRNPLQED
jgi:glycosyltransferase involved in cell wall biosynthesis